MKLCIDCADEIPEDWVRLDPGTMRCAMCQEMHEVDRYERQIRQNELKSNKTGNEKGSAKLPTEKLPNFFICSLCNYKKNQYVDRPCAWCGKTGHINTILNDEKKAFQSKPQLEKVDSDLYFKNLGGVGLIECNECDFSVSITSFSHGEFARRKFSATGYQCELCGEFTTQSSSSPFIEIDLNNRDFSLDKLPYEERPARISHLLSLISICKNGMETTPIEHWPSSWQHTVDTSTQELSKISIHEIDRVKSLIKESNESFKASLKCGCGGKLQRDVSIYCPACKSHKLTYKRGAIT
jgi:hypothetical protein